MAAKKSGGKKAAPFKKKSAKKPGMKKGKVSSKGTSLRRGSRGY